MSASPQLACAVLSLAGEPSLVDAVRSITDQSDPVEIVVVNSGGGDPEARLEEAGLSVPVINIRTPLFPGAVRNIGIEATKAPFVSFLAADCQAEPGWAAARLRAHRAGAGAVASTLTATNRDSRSAAACLLLLHFRRLPEALLCDRLLFGLSYDRRLFRRYGLFREDLRTSEDAEFNSRLAGEIPIAWAPDVRTRHLYPDSPRELIRDLYRRGQLRWVAVRREGCEHQSHIALRRIMDVILSLRAARRTADPAIRRQLMRAWPLLLPGALAAALGTIAASIAPARALDHPSQTALSDQPGRSRRPLAVPADRGAQSPTPPPTEA